MTHSHRPISTESPRRGAQTPCVRLGLNPAPPPSPPPCTTSSSTPCSKPPGTGTCLGTAAAPTPGTPNCSSGCAVMARPAGSTRREPRRHRSPRHPPQLHLHLALLPARQPALHPTPPVGPHPLGTGLPLAHRRRTQT